MQPGSPASRSASPPRSLASAPSGPLVLSTLGSASLGSARPAHRPSARPAPEGPFGRFGNANSAAVLEYRQNVGHVGRPPSPARDTSTLLLDARDRPARDTHTAADAERIHAAVA